MKLFHFHKWGKWEQYDQEFSKHIPPMSAGNWYGLMETWIEKWQKKECLTCGLNKYKGQRNKINLKVSPVVLREEK